MKRGSLLVVLVLVTLVSDLMSLLQHSIAVQRHISKLSISKSRLQVTKDKTLPNEADYVVIGSGIGGLSCAAMLRYYNYSVLVLESHTVPGGVAHGFEKKGFKFDAGPSLWNGMSTKPYNPLREILELTGHGNKIEYAHYDGWKMFIPEGEFKFRVGRGNFEPVIAKFGGKDALTQWEQLLRKLEPIQKLSVSIPPLALRSDVFSAVTLLPYLDKLITGAPVASAVQGPIKNVYKDFLTDKFLNNWLEFLSFALSGLPADGTIAAAVAYTMRDLHQERAALDYPLGGSVAVVDALVSAVESEQTKTLFDEDGDITDHPNSWGKVAVGKHVEKILIDNGRAIGVQLKASSSSSSNNKEPVVIKAKRAVISNAAIWNTVRLLDPSYQSQYSAVEKFVERDSTPRTNSFVHLHVGINATGLSKEALETHYTVINTWDQIDCPQNHVIISVPSVLDPKLAPEGCHVIHAYAAANEPYELWESLKATQNRSAYEAFKKERCEFLYKAIERFLPDLRDRIVVEYLASPLTHERYNRRFKGSFGPAFQAGKESFPYAKTGIEGLLLCGDSVFPGIGVPAVAASGANAASSTVSITKHVKMMSALKKIRDTY